MVPAIAAPLPRAGEIVLITGPSGSGKSSLLRAVRRRLTGARCIDLARLRLADRPVIDLFGTMSLENVLGLLSQFGLAEAYTYLQRPGCLSDGQRWRLRLAKATARGRGREACIICDEFGALLDPVTAVVVARALRKVVDRQAGLSAVVASCREDLLPSLRPDRVVRCDFGAVEAT